MTRLAWPFVSLVSILSLMALGLCVQRILVLESALHQANERAVHLEQDTVEAAQSLFAARVEQVACYQQLQQR